MTDLKYRALLVDPGDTTQERPVQIYGNDRREIDRWASAVLARSVSDDAVVNIYQTTEQKIDFILKPKKEAGPK